MLSLAKLGKGTVSGGLLLKATKRAVKGFSLSDFDLSHNSCFPPLTLNKCLKHYCLLYTDSAFMSRLFSLFYLQRKISAYQALYKPSLLAVDLTVRGAEAEAE